MSLGNRKKAFKTLETKRLYLSLPSSFNDPMDGTVFFSGLGKEECKIFKETIQTILKQHSKSDLAIRLKVLGDYAVQTNRHLVTCFTTTPDESISEGFKYSDVMWAHYADNYKGICIKYNFQQFDYKKVKLYMEDKQTNKISTYGVVSNGESINVNLASVNYTSTPIIAQFNNGLLTKDITYYNSLLNKMASWKNEKEHRIIISAPDGCGFSTDYNFFISQDDCNFEIEEIILGMFISKKNEQKIREIFKDSSVKISKAMVDDSKAFTTWEQF